MKPRCCKLSRATSKRRYTLIAGIIICFALLAVSSNAISQNAKSKKPNVIVILSDDMGYSDIGCFGSEISTPHLDKLAKNGLRFTQFYNTARCSPSRASLLTGLYPHQAGMGHLSTENFPEPGYTDDLSKQAVTMGEVFRLGGYATYMVGKWHIAKNLTPQGDRSNWPMQRGFQRFFGTLNGSGSFYDPGTLMSGNSFIAPSSDFYYTDAISDTAVKYIREHSSRTPFFMYVAFTAAHWPIQAPESAINKNKGMYDKGWDKIRTLRFEKLKKLGILPGNTVLTERGVSIPAWENEPLQKWQSRRMEVYAAMVNIMDEGIGRIITALEQKNELDNTVVFYMQDNGGCAEPLNSNQPEVPPTDVQLKGAYYAPDSVFRGKQPVYSRKGEFIRSGKGVMPGQENTWLTYGEEWANVSNTPFRLYKHWVHEGGIASPLIVHWPKGIKAKGALRKQPAHLIDIMATCIDIAQIPYPQTYGLNTIQPLEGKSLVPSFTNQSIQRDYIFWEHEGNRAIRVNNWKLVSRATTNKKFLPEDERAWELYNLTTDPTETNNLILQFPEKGFELASLWQQAAIRTKALPWPWKSK
jgi:arylsulfatase